MNGYFQRLVYHLSPWVEVNEYGQRKDLGSGSMQLRRFVRDGVTVYADLDGSSGPIAWYVRGGPEEALLGRVDLDGSRYFYATDKQGTVLSAYRDDGATLTLVKAVAYDRTAATQRVPAAGATPATAWRDRFEYAGLEYDPTAQLASDTSRWFDPRSGRYTGQSGPALGNNPYPVAGNNAPNVEPEPEPSAPTPNDDRSLAEQFFDWNVRVGSSLVKPSANAGSGDFLDREVYGRLGNLYNDDRTFRQAFDSGSVGLHFAAGVSNSLSLGLTDFVAKRHGYDDSKRTAAESAAWTAGEVVGLVASFATGIGAARVARISQTVKTLQSAKALLQYQAVSSGVMVAKGTYKATVGGEGLTLENSLMIGGGLLGGRMDLGGLAKLGAAGKVGRGLLAAENAVVKGTGKGVGSVARTVFRTGNEGGQTNALSRMIHAADGTERTGAKAWAARKVADWTGTKACFTGRMPIPVLGGAKPIDQIKDYETYGDECDWVLSRDEFDPDGPLVLRMVLRKFVRLGVVNNLHVGDRLIETTAEHPFFERERHWTEARALRIGDELRLMEPGYIRVEGIADSSRIETVYNLEIEGDHTFFVGCDDWGFAVWAHNDNCSRLLGEALEVAGKAKPVDTISEAAHIVPVLRGGGTFRNRSQAVQDAIRDARQALADVGIGINSAPNGFWATGGRSHMGTHRNKYFLEIGPQLKSAAAQGKAAVEAELQKIIAKAESGVFSGKAYKAK